MEISTPLLNKDYRNYLQYLKVVVPSHYEGHKEMYEEEVKMANDEVEFEDD